MSEPRTNWRTSRLSRHVQILGGRDYSHVADYDGEIPVYGSGGIFASASEALYSGSGVLFGRKGTLNQPLFLKGDFWIADTAFFVRPLRELDARFLYYWACNFPFEFHMTDTAIPSMTSSAIGSERILLPDLGAQHSIARFLDGETAQIDRFIADQETFLRLMTERRDSQITQLVAGATKGVPSEWQATPWAPDIRTPYDSVNIRRVATMRTGHTPSRSTLEYWSGERDIPWFTLADVWQLRAGQKYLGETAENITATGLENSAAELLPRGTVVLSRTASVGFTGIMPQPMATSQDYWNWVCTDDLDPEFLWYQFRAMRPEFDRIKSGSTHKTIYQADAAALRIVLPPIEEQRRIVSILNEQDKITSAIVDDTARAITLAKERRAALITAAVTGQIDVTAKRRPAAEQLEDDIKELS